MRPVHASPPILNAPLEEIDQDITFVQALRRSAYGPAAWAQSALATILLGGDLVGRASPSAALRASARAVERRSRGGGQNRRRAVADGTCPTTARTATVSVTLPAGAIVAISCRTCFSKSGLCSGGICMGESAEKMWPMMKSMPIVLSYVCPQRSMPV